LKNLKYVNKEVYKDDKMQYKTYFSQNVQVVHIILSKLMHYFLIEITICIYHIYYKSSVHFELFLDNKKQ